MAARLGLEPRQAESESAVLPLHHRALRFLSNGMIEEMEPATGIEPVTACLQNRCSTIELRRQKLGRGGRKPVAGRLRLFKGGKCGKER